MTKSKKQRDYINHNSFKEYVNKVKKISLLFNSLSKELETMPNSNTYYTNKFYEFDVLNFYTFNLIDITKSEEKILESLSTIKKEKLENFIIDPLPQNLPLNNFTMPPALMQSGMIAYEQKVLPKDDLILEEPLISNNLDDEPKYKKHKEN